MPNVFCNFIFLNGNLAQIFENSKNREILTFFSQTFDQKLKKNILNGNLAQKIKKLNFKRQFVDLLKNFQKKRQFSINF